MNERDPRTGAGVEPPLDDEAIGRMIRDAGKRPSIPREDLDAIAASARAAWDRRNAPRHAQAAQPAAAPWRGSERRAPPLVAALAIAAAVAALIFGLRLLSTATRDEGAAPPTPARVATFVSGSAFSRVEVDGVERPLATGEEVVAGTVIRVGSGRPGGDTGDAATGTRGAALLLENGVAIRFEAGSTARLESPTRVDLLAGAIYADSDATGDLRGGPGAGDRAAIAVHTAAGVARDVGTRFAARVTDSAQGPTLRVLVRSGAVSVERAGESKLARAGQQIVASEATIDVSPAATHGPEWEWILDAAPPFDVAGRSIGEILDWVAGETGWTVRYEDAALEQAARSTVLQASRSQGVALRADQAPFLLLPGANLDSDLEQGVLSVRRR